ncbi:hypothetical protein HYU95_02395 [Candidatus Daviesbacteria bacterium]|nr:hypothetical protein [Candidatus Daviesbacteria bacterium]
MKLISLNTWCGRIFDPLIEFIQQNSKDTDIFCFQEIFDTNSDIKQYKNIRANLLSEIKSILSGFKVFYFPIMHGLDGNANPIDFNLTFGQAIFIADTIKSNSNENYFISKRKDSQILKKDFSNQSTPLQFVSFNFNGKDFTVFNFHGIPFPGDKLDTEKRLKNSEKVKEIVNSKSGSKILVGDFNLLPQTQSIKIFENNMRNLIKEFKIQRTRSKQSPFYGRKDFQKFADYTFVSHDVKIESFEVSRAEVSDHLPMILEFS